MRRICPENVDKLCCKDCSSPMSAKTCENHGISTGSRAGTNKPTLAMIAANPKVFNVTVFPPVFGPVIVTTRIWGLINKSTGTTGFPCSCCCCQTNKGWRRFRKVMISLSSRLTKRGGLEPIHRL